MIPPAPKEARLSTLSALRRYWPANEKPVLALPLDTTSPVPAGPLPPVLREIELPAFLAPAGVEGRILVPAHLLGKGEADAWDRVDWLGAATWYLHGLAEREHERLHGTIHSYASRLPGWDRRMFQRAWVNRIGLMLRMWAADGSGAGAQRLLGPLPESEIVLTHDVDAVRKTLAIRLKQSAFLGYGGFRHLFRGRGAKATDRFGKAVRFLLSGEDYWNFERIRLLEDRHGIRSHYFVYAGSGGLLRPPAELLFDPGYRVQEPRLASELRRLDSQGYTVGLHPSFRSFEDPGRLRAERTRLEAAVGKPVRACRQHWLRFRWSTTWRAQQEAGFEEDMTLGFNDVPGFRVGAALRFQPLDPQTGRSLSIRAVPLALMDSQLYDYVDLSDEERREAMRRLVGEIRDVRGVATFLWHQQVMGSDYGWSRGYEDLLEIVRGER